MNFVVSLCFFLSGMSGLCFEVLWTRQLEQVFGASTLALSSVLTSYMAGLALGSFLAGKLIHKIRRPVLAYGLCEVGVAAFGLLIPLLISVYPELYRLLWNNFYGSSFYLFSLLRFLLVFVTLLFPTTLMGATLPLLTRFSSQRIRVSGAGASLAVTRAVSRLYALNLAGACVGTFFTGFVLLPSLGISQTTLVAASINISLALVLGLGALWEKRAQEAARALENDEERSLRELLRKEAEEQVEKEEGAHITPLSQSARVAVAAAFGISGAASMVYQVLWTRAIAIVIGSSVYAFTLILGCFLIGLFTGSALAAWALRIIRRPLEVLGAAHLMVALSAYATARYIDRLPQLFLDLVAYREAQEVWQVLGVNLFISAVVVLIPTCFLGTIFPLTIRLLGQKKENAAQEVGAAYAANTLGAITGSFAGGFLVLPWIGLERGLYGTVLISGLLGALLWGFVRREGGKARVLKGVFVLGSLGLLTALVALAPAWDLGRLNEGFFRLSLAREIYEEGDDSSSRKILYYRDGVTTTVSLEDFGNGVLALKVNGKVDASSSTDMPTQILAGALPVALHPEVGERPLRAAVVGFGSGVTLGSALRFPISRLDAIEIEREVVEAARFFGDLNHQVHKDPRLSIYYDDGRNFLQSTDEKYDVIVNEPSNPWIAGIANLFTREYFTRIRQRLAPRGIFLQWLQLYEISPETVRLIVRTFREVFPEGVLFCADSRSPDLFLIGSTGEVPLDLEAITRAFALPGVASEFGRAGVEVPADLFARFLMGAEDLGRFAGEGPINTDDNGILEFTAPRDLILWAKHKNTIRDFYDDMFEVKEEAPRIDGLIRLGGEGEEARRREALFAERLAVAGRFRAALRYADRADGLPPGSSTLRLPLGPVRAGPFEGGAWHLSAARARVYTAFFQTPDAESPPVPDSIIKTPPPPPKDPREVRPPNDDIKAMLLTLFAQARRREAAIPQDAPERDYDIAIAWQAPYEALLGFPSFFVQNNDWMILKGVLSYKVGFWREAVDILWEVIEEEPGVRGRVPQVSYYLARAEMSRGYPQRAIRALTWYLALSESPFAERLRRELEPVPLELFENLEKENER